MIIRFTALSAAFVLLLLATSSAHAQQQGNADMANMPGMKDGKSGTQSHDMQGMDMQSMVKQCAQIRQQMKPGAAMSPDMQKTMSQCDEMDRQMKTPSQDYVPPQQRRR